VLARAFSSSQSMRSGARIVFAPTGKEGAPGARRARAPPALYTLNEASPMIRSDQGFANLGPGPAQIPEGTFGLLRKRGAGPPRDLL